MRLSFPAGIAPLAISVSSAAARAQAATPIPRSAASAGISMSVASGPWIAEPFEATAAPPLAPQKHITSVATKYGERPVIEPSEIQNWTRMVADHDRMHEVEDHRHPIQTIDPSANDRVALFQGDIVTLHVDVTVNCAVAI